MNDKVLQDLIDAIENCEFSPDQVVSLKYHLILQKYEDRIANEDLERCYLALHETEACFKPLSTLDNFDYDPEHHGVDALTTTLLKIYRDVLSEF